MKKMNKILKAGCIGVLMITVIAAGEQSESTYLLSQNIQAQNIFDQLPQQKNIAFKEGEVLTSRMHYGAMNAGMAVLEVKPDLIEVNGRKVYHIVGNGFTIGSADWFFKVRDRYETYMDKDALLPWLFVRRVDEGGYKFSQDYSFNHYTKKVDIGNGEKYDVPLGVQDMVSAFYSARNLDLSNAKEGDTYSVDCFVDKELWPLKIKFLGREEIKTDLGKFRCLKFVPIVQKGRVFKKDEDLLVWISDDLNHIPMRAQAKVLVGSIKMDITAVKNLSNPCSKVD
jgi:hypothetical protein